MEIIAVNPQHNTQGVGLGQIVTITFDVAIDPHSALHNIVFATSAKNLSFQGFMATIIPGGNETLKQFALKSEEFTGIVDGEYSFSDDYKTVTFKPDAPLTTNTVYVCIISENLLTKTIDGPTYSSYNTGNGDVGLIGPYKKDINDTLKVEITEGGGLGIAKFVYSLGSLPGECSEELTVDRYLEIIYGMTLNFALGSYNVGDGFSFDLIPGIPLGNNYGWTFSSGSGSIIIPPIDEVSTSLEDVEVTGIASQAWAIVPEYGEANISPAKLIFAFPKAINWSASDLTSIQFGYRGLSFADEDPGELVDLSFTTTTSLKSLTVIPTLAFEQNKEIWILIPANALTFTDGSSNDKIESYFITSLTPMYTQPGKIKLLATGLLDAVSDSQLALLIYTYSLIADGYDFPEDLNALKIQLVICLVINALARSAQSVTSKRLGDFSISFKGDPLKDWAEECLEGLEGLFKGQRLITAFRTIYSGSFPENRPVWGLEDFYSDRTISPFRDPKYGS